MMRQGIFIVGAKRTPFGAFCGKLKDHASTDLAVVAMRAALKNASLEPEHVDLVTVGNVIQSCRMSVLMPRHAALRTGIPESTPALLVNRACTSGFQAVITSAQHILLGESNLAVACGTDNMTQTPYVIRRARFGLPFASSGELEDYLWTVLQDEHLNMSMGMTAEKLGGAYGISREECDAYAHRSQTTYHQALEAKHFEAEIEPVTVKAKRSEEVFDTDEHPRRTTVEGLLKLKAVFKKDGIVTAGNASGVCDGAAAVVVANESSVKAHNLQPLCRVVGYHVTGCDPTIMGIGPVEAIRGVCKKTGVNLDQVEHIEINEAFAAQVLACQKELKIEADRLNINGGAIAIGHPLGASGARITAHLAQEIKRRGIRYAIGSACAGGGQGVAVLLERV